jgi:hypothetical protein
MGTIRINNPATMLGYYEYERHYNALPALEGR